MAFGRKKLSDEEKEIAREAAGFKRGLGHFYLFLLGGTVVLMLLSPIFNRFLDYYQGVVVAPPQDGEVTILRHDSLIATPSMGKAAADLTVGDYVLKSRLSWNPVEIPREGLTDIEGLEAADQPPVRLPDYYERYVLTWEGTVTAVRRQQLPVEQKVGLMGASKTERITAVVLLDEGGTRELEVPDELLGQVGVGTRLAKRSGQWTPMVTGQASTLEAPTPSP